MAHRRHSWLLVAVIVAGCVTRAEPRRDLPPPPPPAAALPAATAPVLLDVELAAPGLTTEEVEARDTLALELALGGLPDLQQIESRSSAAQATLRLTFPPNTDPALATLRVRERLVTASLPDGQRPPRIAPSPEGSRRLRYTLESQGVDPLNLQRIHESVIRRALLAVPGVEAVRSCGGAGEKVVATVDPARLVRSRLTLEDVLHTVGESLALPAAGGGGRPGGPVIVRGFPISSSGSLGELGDIVIPVPSPGGDSVPVRLREVADVSLSVDTQDCVALGDERRPVLAGEVQVRADRESRVIEQVRAAIEGLLPLLPIDVKLRLFDEEQGAAWIPTAPPLRLRLLLSNPTAQATTSRARLERELEDAVRAIPVVRSVLVLSSQPGEFELLVACQPRERWPLTVRSTEELITALFVAIDGTQQPFSLVEMQAERGVPDARWRPLRIRVSGASLETLREVTDKATARLDSLKGVATIHAEGGATVMRMNVEPRPEELARHGIPRRQFAETVAALLGGREVGAFYRAEQRVPVLVRLPPLPPDDPARVGAATIPLRGRIVPLRELANLSLETAPAVILRRRGRREVVLRVTAPSLAPAALLKEVRARLIDLPLPFGVTIEFE